MLDIMFDPQTSGGLLISVAEKDADRLLSDLSAHTEAAVIGYTGEYSGYDLEIT